MPRIQFISILIIALLVFSCSTKKEGSLSLDEIQKRVSGYADVVITTDYSQLDKIQKKVLGELFAAARIADEIFWMQSGHDAVATREMVKNQPDVIQKYVAINYGPYDRIYENKRFTGDGPSLKPEGAGFYPEDMTREEFEKFITDHPEQKNVLENLYTVVQRKEGQLIAVFYHDAYANQVNEMAAHLEKAAEYADNESLKKYLFLRANALRTDDYYQSDLAWMDLNNNTIDIVIGPIENYEDRMFNYKAAFESAVMLKDIPASAELETYKTYLTELERNLPIEDKYKKESAGSGNVLEVVNIQYFGGDFQAGIKTIAASLPNDERIISQKGAKKQLYKNIIEAKFDKILLPIADKLTDPDQRQYISQKAFMSQVLLHELSHTLGPDYVYNTEESVRRSLRDKYSIIEECKADVLGIYHIDFLKSIFKMNDEQLAQNYITYIAGLFRSVRFGYKEAHGAANLIQLNFLENEGVLKRNSENGYYTVDVSGFHQAISKLATRLLMIEALGDYNEAQKIIIELGQIKEITIRDIDKLAEISRDLDLHFKW